MSPTESQSVRDFLRSYVGCGRCGMVDDLRWSEQQQLYGQVLCALLFEVLDREETDYLILVKGEIVDEKQATNIGIPQDIIDAAKQVGMDLDTLAKLCVKHSVTAVKDFLSWLTSKLPAYKKP